MVAPAHTKFSLPIIKAAVAAIARITNDLESSENERDLGMLL